MKMVDSLSKSEGRKDGEVRWKISPSFSSQKTAAQSSVFRP